MRDSDYGCLQEWARLMSIMCILVFIRTLKRLVFLHRHWVFFRERKTDVVMLNSAYVLSVGVIWLLWTLKDNITFLGLILVVSFEKSKEMGERVNWRRWRKEFCKAWKCLRNYVLVEVEGEDVLFCICLYVGSWSGRRNRSSWRQWVQKN